MNFPLYVNCVFVNKMSSTLSRVNVSVRVMFIGELGGGTPIVLRQSISKDIVTVDLL